MLHFIFSIYCAALCFLCSQQLACFLAYYQIRSVAQSYLTLCDPMNRSTPGLPVHRQHPEFTQTHVHQVSDAIQPHHPLLSPSPPALNPSQHQGLFQWVSASHEVAKVLEFQPQHQSFQWTPMTDSPLGWTGWISLQSKGLPRVFSNTTVQKHQFWVSHSVVSNSFWPHGLQPTKLLGPWDFPGKNTRVGCHCLLQFLEWGHHYFFKAT